MSVLYWATRDSLKARTDEDAAMAHASITKNEPDLLVAKKALANYMLDEANDLANRDWAEKRVKDLRDKALDVMAAEFIGEDSWEALSFDADSTLRFQLIRVEKGE